MTILQLEVLFHYYCTQTRDYYRALIPDEGRSQLQDLVETGVVINNHPAPPEAGPRYQITERGRCHVEALKRLPLPTSGWRSPLDDLLEGDSEVQA